MRPPLLKCVKKNMVYDHIAYCCMILYILIHSHLFVYVLNSTKKSNRPSEMCPLAPTGTAS